jgi:hypothetical protein
MLPLQNREGSFVQTELQEPPDGEKSLRGDIHSALAEGRGLSSSILAAPPELSDLELLVTDSSDDAARRMSKGTGFTG